MRSGRIAAGSNCDFVGASAGARTGADAGGRASPLHGSGLADLPAELFADICARAAAGYAPRALRLAEVSRDMRAAIAASPALWAAALAARLQAAPAERARAILRQARRDPRWSAGAPYLDEVRLNGPDTSPPVCPKTTSRATALAPACLFGSRPATLRLTGLAGLSVVGGGYPARPLRGLGHLTTLVRLEADLDGHCSRQVQPASLAPLVRLASLSLRRGALAEGALAQIAALSRLTALVLDRVALACERLTPLVAGAGALRSLGLAWEYGLDATGIDDDDVQAIGRLSQLESLALLARRHDSRLDMAPLAALTQLRSLDLAHLDRLPPLTMAGLTHLGLLHSVADGCLAGAVNMSQLCELDVRSDLGVGTYYTRWRLQPEEADWLARHAQLHSLKATGRAAQAALLAGPAPLSGIARLPFDVRDGDCFAVQWAGRGEHLTQLHLCYYRTDWEADSPSLLTCALLPLADLEVLCLAADFRAHAEAVTAVAQLPRLRTLVLSQEPDYFDGDSRLEAGGLACLTGLAALAIESGPSLRSAHLSAIGALTGLRSLRLSPQYGLRPAHLPALRRLPRLRGLHLTLRQASVAALDCLRPLRELTDLGVRVVDGDYGGRPSVVPFDEVRHHVALADVATREAVPGAGRDLMRDARCALSGMWGSCTWPHASS